VRQVLRLELSLLSSSPVRVLAQTLSPLAPPLLWLAGMLDPGLVAPLFLLVYQLVAMILMPSQAGLVRGGWGLAWLLGPPAPAAAALAYLALFAVNSVLPIAALQALLSLTVGASLNLNTAAHTSFLITLGLLHQSLGTLLLSRTRGSGSGLAVVIVYQAVLLSLASSVLAGGLRNSHPALAVLFPALLAITPLPTAEALFAAALTSAASLLFTYLAIHRLFNPPPQLHG